LAPPLKVDDMTESSRNRVRTAAGLILLTLFVSTLAIVGQVLAHFTLGNQRAP
jgi:hypothetical protein